MTTRGFLGFLALLLAAGSALASPPPAGRYRCYQPPGYAVISWFDFEADGTYRLQGGAPAKYRWEPARSLVRWLEGEHAAERLVGIYQPPPDAGQWPRRHTIVLARNDEMRPGSRGWDKLPQCYLTEH